MGLIKNNTTQEQRVLAELIAAKGGWLSSDYFERTLMLSQFHRAKHNLIHHKERYGYKGKIEPSDFRNEHGFMCYRLIEEVEIEIKKEVKQELKQEGLPLKLSQIYV